MLGVGGANASGVQSAGGPGSKNCRQSANRRLLLKFRFCPSTRAACEGSSLLALRWPSLRATSIDTIFRLPAGSVVGAWAQRPFLYASVVYTTLASLLPAAALISLLTPKRKILQ